MTEAGWVMAPREVTEEMFARGQTQAEECTADFTCRSACISEHVWEAMLAAAPPPSDEMIERMARAYEAELLGPCTAAISWEKSGPRRMKAMRAALAVQGEVKP